MIREGTPPSRQIHRFQAFLRPLWQYLLLHWARAVLGGLTALAVAAALLRSFTPFSVLVWYIVGATLGTVFISHRRWQRGQAQAHTARSDTQN